MFDWLKFIGDFFLGMLEGIPNLLAMVGDAYAVVNQCFAAAPDFLVPIMYLMLAVILLMWVVNIF